MASCRWGQIWQFDFARKASLATLAVGTAILLAIAALGLGAAATAAGATLDFIIDVDVGLGRTGVESPQAAVAVAEAAAGTGSMRLRGVQGYGGQWQHMVGLEARREATETGMARLSTHPNVVVKVGAIPGTLPEPMRRPPGCRFAPRCGFATDRCRRERPPLVDAGAGHLVACWEIDSVRKAA